ncbi:MAG: hypothetical protein PHP62_06145 [Candidatus Moranbacteria bacterium]|nr:hypothetical protein [Candidatus Moranbacteria bacterium]
MKDNIKGTYEELQEPEFNRIDRSLMIERYFWNNNVAHQNSIESPDMQHPGPNLTPYDYWKGKSPKK